MARFGEFCRRRAIRKISRPRISRASKISAISKGRGISEEKRGPDDSLEADDAAGAVVVWVVPVEEVPDGVVAL